MSKNVEERFFESFKEQIDKTLGDILSYRLYFEDLSFNVAGND